MRRGKTASRIAAAFVLDLGRILLSSRKAKQSRPEHTEMLCRSVMEPYPVQQAARIYAMLQPCTPGGQVVMSCHVDTRCVCVCVCANAIHLYSYTPCSNQLLRTLSQHGSRDRSEEKPIRSARTALSRLVCTGPPQRTRAVQDGAFLSQETPSRAQADGG